jgi:hypothetical protein
LRQGGASQIFGDSGELMGYLSGVQNQSMPGHAGSIMDCAGSGAATALLKGGMLLRVRHKKAVSRYACPRSPKLNLSRQLEMIDILIGSYARIGSRISSFAISLLYPLKNVEDSFASCHLGGFRV